MTVARIIAALELPDAALVQRRIPKKLLLEHGAPTAADKRRIQEGIQELSWIAVLKPTTIGLAAFRDDAREYLEAAVVTAGLRPTAKPARLVELIHRAIPYPVILFTSQGDDVTLSLAHKRWSQGKTGKVVLEDLRQVTLEPDPPLATETAFLATLRLSGLPNRDMFTLYDGLFSRLLALEASRVTGIYRTDTPADSAVKRRDSLDRHAKFIRDLAILRATAHKEKQLNRRVELNLEIKRLEAALADIENEI